MATTTFRSAVSDGKIALGLCNMYPAAGIIEGMCGGWDFVWIDGQHGQIGPREALDAIRAARSCGVLSLFRVPGHDATMLGVAADLAADGYLVPMVNSADQAREIVAAFNFPPLGTRSYGGRRPIDLAGRGYYQSRPFILAQIETPQAADAAGDIAAVEGVDGLFFGPDDMKTTLGLPIDQKITQEPRLLAAFEKTAAAARATGKALATVAGDAESIALYLKLGCNLMVCGGDAAFIRGSASAKLIECRKLTQGHGPAGTATATTGGSSPY